jgi:hypothetical protein
MMGTWAYGILRRNTNNSDKLFGFIALAAAAFKSWDAVSSSDRWVIGDDPFARLADVGSRITALSWRLSSPLHF